MKKLIEWVRATLRRWQIERLEDERMYTVAEIHTARERLTQQTARLEQLIERGTA